MVVHRDNALLINKAESVTLCHKVAWRISPNIPHFKVFQSAWQSVAILKDLFGILPTGSIHHLDACSFFKRVMYAELTLYILSALPVTRDCDSSSILLIPGRHIFVHTAGETRALAA